MILKNVVSNVGFWGCKFGYPHYFTLSDKDECDKGHQKCDFCFCNDYEYKEA